MSQASEPVELVQIYPPGSRPIGPTLRIGKTLTDATGLRLVEPVIFLTIDDSPPFYLTREGLIDAVDAALAAGDKS